MLTFFYAFLMLIIIHSKKASFWTYFLHRPFKSVVTIWDGFLN